MIMTAWQGSSALQIDWRGLCRSTAADKGGDVRILLDDRDQAGPSIDGCTQPDRPGPWAVYPNMAMQYADCEWNMVLPVFLERKNPVLHTAGHALGLSHHHTVSLAEAGPCPEHTPSHPHSPYLASYDPASVMHPREDDHDAYFGNPWLDCDAVDDSGPILDDLSAGDLLAIEMIYPRSGAPTFGSSTWILSAGVRTYRDDSVVLMSDWLARGANASWFRSAYWEVKYPDGTAALFGQPLAEPRALGANSIQLSHIFTDPFGAYHSQDESVAISTSQHTAGVLSAVY